MENSTQDKNYAYFQDVIREMLKLMGLQIKLKKINSRRFSVRFGPKIDILQFQN
ncbi:hypothetical protein BSUW23_20030 [Bacillus spizizenii str. W23]|uniref:Uncharacterized protein n=1 Tax=Bacillus spizizenii (strain ATCC 23059 / NRRL B-14472 / W23) TaxID=655816 RepID=E0TZ89_BACSH|nr:hypothetical protein BSUW23_20030 [Bacillus spizizenii str. W23]EFG93854.1 hypothetical protein BSU6633_02519 [Bacillus spizizenii ATCC 6633 = JCM 2499]